MYAVVKTGGKQYGLPPAKNSRSNRYRRTWAREVDARSGADGRRRRERPARDSPWSPARRSRPPSSRHGRGDKVKIFKMRRRKHYQKHQGHRQNYTELKIDSIVG